MVREDRSVESGICCAERISQVIPGAHLPTDLVYALRVSRYRDSI
jgi:hypothetical protein